MKYLVNAIALALGSGVALAIYTVAIRESKVNATSVVERVRSSSELTTAIYSTQTFVSVERSQPTAIGLINPRSRVGYSALVRVRAGVDLSQVSESDVEIGDTIVLNLPTPTIQDVNLDAEKSRPEFQDRGFLSLGPDTQALIEVAEQKAIAGVRQQACDSGLLDQAAVEARTALEKLLAGTGREVRVNVQKPAKC